MGTNVEFDFTYYEEVQQVETDVSNTTWDDMLDRDEISAWENAFMQGIDRASN